VGFDRFFNDYCGMIPPYLRKVENLHVFFWLVKDICWVTDLKIPGLIMIFPTISIAYWVAVRTRKQPSEFAHNLAVAMWITANSIWMIGEFYFEDGSRSLARVFFAAGLLSLLVYYIGWGMGKFRVLEAPK